MRSRREFEQFAREVREAFYAGKPHPNVVRRDAQRRREPSGASDRSTGPAAATKTAKRCPGQNAWWRGAVAKGLNVARVLASADVSDEVYERRNAACRVCQYCGEADDKRYCGCCGCPQWHVGGIGSDMGYKNRKAGWGCPGPHRAFEAME